MFWVSVEFAFFVSLCRLPGRMLVRLYKARRAEGCDVTGAWKCFGLGLSAKELGERCHNRKNQ